MKANIHPKWYETKVVCAGCSREFTVGSTIPEIHIEVCSNCHPFYTGQMRYVDTAGRVDRFRAKQSLAKDTSQLSKRDRRLTKQKKRLEEELSRPTSLSELSTK